MPTHVHLPVSTISEYRCLLVQLIMSYLIKHPQDYLDFALEFFSKKEKEKTFRYNSNYVSEVYAFPESNESEQESSIHEEISDNFEDLPIRQKSEDTKIKIIKLLERILIFKFLRKFQVPRIVDSMKRKRVKKGELIIEQNEEGDNFYVITSGDFEAFVEEDEGKKIVLKTYKKEGYFGELALIHQQPRACNVVALSDGLLYAIDAAVFKRVMTESSRRMNEILRESILEVPYFAALNTKEVRVVIDEVIHLQYSRGQKIFNQKEEADGLYFVLHGEVDTSTEDPSGTKTSKILKAGDHFGELSILDRSLRLVSCFALSDACLAFLSIEKFDKLFGPSLEKFRIKIDLCRDPESKVTQLIESAKDLRLHMSKPFWK